MENTIQEKLKEVQSIIKAPKSQYNSFGRYNYRNCEDILNAVKPLLHERNCILTLSDELVNIGDRYYIKATATVCKCDKPEEKISVTSFAREEESKKGMDGSQVTGASSSYARKYALNGLFNIDDTKDSDTTNGIYDNQTIKPKQQKAKENTKVICTKCGKEIKTVKKPDGTIVEAEQIYDSCGKMCISCYTANSSK